MYRTRQHVQVFEKKKLQCSCRVAASRALIALGKLLPVPVLHLPAE
jgi:hypothetical protein